MHFTQEQGDRQTYRLLLVVVVCLVGFGTVMVYSASAIRAYSHDGSSTLYLFRHLSSIMIGVVAMAPIKRARREYLFIELLESIHPKEAELLLQMKDKKLNTGESDEIDSYFIAHMNRGVELISSRIKTLSDVASLA